MYPIIEQLANDAGISPDNADYIFTVLAGELVSRVPGLGQIIEDIFTNADKEQLARHINKMISLLQQQGMEQFKSWTTPHPSFSIRETGTDHIL